MKHFPIEWLTALGFVASGFLNTPIIAAASTQPNAAAMSAHLHVSAAFFALLVSTLPSAALPLKSRGRSTARFTPFQQMRAARMWLICSGTGLAVAFLAPKNVKVFYPQATGIGIALASLSFVALLLLEARKAR